MHSPQLFFVILLLSSFLLPSSPLSPPQESGNRLSTASGPNPLSSSPFSIALETLEKNIGYEFQSIDLLGRAMTHASYSADNNRALAILGLDVIQTAVSLRSLKENIDISAKDLNSLIVEISKEASCAAYGFRLGLQNVVRVSTKTNSSAPVVVCGAFKAVFGAVAVDTSKADDAGDVFWKVKGSHGNDTVVFDL
ncbi:protein NUCLEAR FUSION DEFECTIVE 2 [Magnolia sinica]|uniref:protein NUCLEAR FUSION DEFECTIVE 2 n=1 Tax=Magnolia sinica TaxID=86752 RepID=UPI002657C477|nr:protein NUCLEAR FUSION DEFECTIVE 2 [Magnolia sinica]